MATTEQIKALVRSYSEGDGDHFLSVALQIAAHAARGGQGKFAQELRDLVDEVKRQQAAGKVGGAVPIARPAGELAGLLTATYPKVRLSEMVLAEDIRAKLDRVFENIVSRRRFAATACPHVANCCLSVHRGVEKR